MSFFRLVPNLNIMAPKDFKELEDMLEFAISLGKPVVIRYPRGGESKEKFEKHNKIKLGKAEIIKRGNDISIMAIGKTVSRALIVSKMLEKDGFDTEVINVRFLKPFDKETIKKSIEKTKKVITIEDGTVINGLATTIKELIIDEKIEKREEVRGRITYFIADGRSKDTGTVMEVSGVIKKLDKINGTIKIGDDIILVKNIYDINLEDHKDEI